MFSNIGGKIKTLAKIIFAVEAVIIVIWAFKLLFSEYEEVRLTGLIVLVVGLLVSWISSWFLYGFGELIETNQLLVDTLESDLVPAINKLARSVGAEPEPKSYYGAPARETADAPVSEPPLVDSRLPVEKRLEKLRNLADLGEITASRYKTEVAVLKNSGAITEEQYNEALKDL